MSDRPKWWAVALAAAVVLAVALLGATDTAPAPPPGLSTATAP